MNKPIQCPCGHIVMQHDGKSEIPKTAKCTLCGRFVRYNPTKKRITIVAIPERKTSSGIRFY